MNITEVVSVIVGVTAIIAFIWRVSYMLNRKVSYDAFDRHKHEVEAKFRTEKTCDILRDHILRDIAEIKDSVKDIGEIKSDIKSLLSRHE